MIINHLGKEFDKEFTMHELSKKLHIPYASFYRTINKMKELLAIKEIGKAKTLKLNLQNPVIQSYLAISSEEEKRSFLERNPMIREISKDLRVEDIVLLFGSYAKGEEGKKSDIDLMIINKSGNKTISFSKYELIFDKQINPVFLKIPEFQEMIKDNEENVGKQALRNHIVLNNPNHFWNVVLDAI